MVWGKLPTCSQEWGTPTQKVYLGMLNMLRTFLHFPMTVVKPKKPKLDKKINKVVKMINSQTLLG